jgi:hypothetical protein
MRVSDISSSQGSPVPAARALTCLLDGAGLLLAETFFNELADRLRPRGDHGLLPAPLIDTLNNQVFDSGVNCFAFVRHRCVSCGDETAAVLQENGPS